MHATIDCDRRLCIHTVKYAKTRRIVDKKGRGGRGSSSLADEVRLISQRNSSIARAINRFFLSTVLSVTYETLSENNLCLKQTFLLSPLDVITGVIARSILCPHARSVNVSV